MSSTQQATILDRDAGSPKKKAGSWLREQRQKGLSHMDLANAAEVVETIKKACRIRPVAPAR
jgi:hypothetical protein